MEAQVAKAICTLMIQLCSDLSLPSYYIALLTGVSFISSPLVQPLNTETCVKLEVIVLIVLDFIHFSKVGLIKWQRLTGNRGLLPGRSRAT